MKGSSQEGLVSVLLGAFGGSNFLTVCLREGRSGTKMDMHLALQMDKEPPPAWVPREVIGKGRMVTSLEMNHKMERDT